MKMLDCFCGMGGVSDGFALEGFDVIGIDIVDAPKILDYKHKFILADMLILKGEDFRGYDVIWGSPPCREQSPCAKVWGHRWKKPPNLKENLNLIKAFLEFVRVAQPKIWIMENHPNLAQRIEQKPIFIGKVSKGMRRAFWSNQQLFFLNPSTTKQSIWKGKFNNKIRSWQRAKIPLPCSRAFAQACKDKLLETI